ncbi:MAG: hypothetical protein CMP10_07200 [Zetaproteobacteria bacterium]|nr:hypothetical protein [Pseudobdellovibrionaceae bacterium]
MGWEKQGLVILAHTLLCLCKRRLMARYHLRMRKFWGLGDEGPPRPLAQYKCSSVSVTSAFFFFDFLRVTSIFLSLFNLLDSKSYVRFLSEYMQQTITPPVIRV